jgi:DNA invertase Pin-like site-specific DNA recombinase
MTVSYRPASRRKDLRPGSLDSACRAQTGGLRGDCAEKASGARRDSRTELQALLDFLRAGGTLVVTRIDRLARSLKDLRDIVHELKAKDVTLKSDRTAGRYR